MLSILMGILSTIIAIPVMLIMWIGSLGWIVIGFLVVLISLVLLKIMEK